MVQANGISCCVANNLINSWNGREVFPSHPERPAETLHTSWFFSVAEDWIDFSDFRQRHRLFTAAQNFWDSRVIHPCGMKTRVAQQPALLFVRELESPPVLGTENLVDALGFRLGEAGTIKLVALGKHVSGIVIAQQENVILRFIHSVTQPESRPSRVAYIILEIIEEIPEEDHPVVFLTSKPILRVFGVIMEVGNEEDSHHARSLPTGVTARIMPPSSKKASCRMMDFSGAQKL